MTRTEGWPPERQMLAAAMVDVLWSVATYERLTINWRADLSQVIEGVSWVISLIERDVKDGQGPG